MRIPGTTFTDNDVPDPKDALSLAVEACRAALRYDEAVRKFAEEGKPWVEDDNLDGLYNDWVEKAQQVVAGADGQ